MCHKMNKEKFWMNAMHHLMGGTSQEKEQLKRYSNQDFIGSLFSEIVLNGLKYATDAKRLEISAAEMKCH